MKKNLLRAFIALSATLLLAGCSDNTAPFVPKSYDANGTQIEEIVIEVRDREIEVSVSADDQIHIAYSESEQEFYDVSVSDGGVLTMTAQSNKEWTDYIGGKPAADARKIFLQVPGALLSGLTLTTTNENITLAPLKVAGDVALSVNGGNIVFEELNVGNSLTLTGKNGDIRGSIVGSYDDFSISTELKKGESNLPADKTDGSKALRVQNNNGDIDIAFVKE